MSDLPYVIVRRTDPTQVRLIGPQHGAWERGYQQGHTDALSRRAPVSLEEIVEVLTKIIDADDAKDVPDRFGLSDCVDAGGQPYQSAHLHGIISRARSLLDRLSNKGEE